MATLASLVVKLGLNPKQFKSGLQTAHDALKKFRDENTKTFEAPAKALSKLGKAMAISSGAASATVAASGLTNVVVALAGATVAASGSLLLLPGAAAAGGVAFGALKIATSGFGAALAAVGDPEKFAEAVKTLSPAARSAAEAVRDLKPAYDGLKSSLQEKLFAGLAPQIRDTGAALIGTLRPAFERVASSANTAISGVLTDLASVRRQADLSQISGDSATAFGNLVAAVRPLVSVLLDVVAVGTSMLPGLTSGAGGAVQRFADMVTQMRESGRLREIIQGGLDALSQLGQLAGNVGHIIGSVFSAMQAQGGGALGVLVQLTGEARAFLESARGQEVLATVFGTLHSLVQALLPGVRAIGGALMDVVTSVLPALPGLGAAFSAAATSVAPLVSWLGDLAGTVLPPLVSALGFLAPALGPLAGYIGLIVAAVKAWSIAQAILNVALTANPIGIIIVAIGALIAILVLAWNHSETFRSIVIGAWEAIKTAVGAAVDWVVNFVKSNWPLLLGLIGGPIGAVVALVIMNWDRIKSLFQTGVNLVMEYWGYLAALPGRAAEWFGGIVRAAGDKIGELLNWVRGIPDRVLGALGDLGSLLWDAGRSIINGLVEGIKSAVGYLRSTLGWVTGMIPDWKGPMTVDRKLLLASGEAIMGGLIRGIATRIGDLRRKLSGVTDLIAIDYGTVSDGAWNRLRAMGYQGRADDGREALYVPRNVAAAVTGLGGQGQVPTVRLEAGDALMDALLEQMRNELRARGLRGVLG